MEAGQPEPDRKAPAALDREVRADDAPGKDGAPPPEPQASATSGALTQKLVLWAKRIPRKTTALVLAILLLAYGAWKIFYVAETATLNLKGQHSFRSAQLSVWVDGKLVQRAQLIGSTKKRFGILQQSAQGSFSRTIRLPAGEHVIRVSITAPNEGYTQSDEVQAEFQAKTQRTIIITPDRRSGKLSLAWRDTPGFAAATSSSSGTGGLISSLLLTIAGSILSAVVGFFVRERLATMRSKKS